MFPGVKGTSSSISVPQQNLPPTGGASDTSGHLSAQKDAKESSTAPKFGDVWNQIQSKYGAKPEKPREIKKSLGKDDFLRIMISQMKHQDPTQPFKAEQFATELAQFTSVEQLQNLNQSMNKMANQSQPLERLSMTSLIGKTVTVDRERFPHAEGTNDNLSFMLPKDAAQVRLAVIAENGETIFDKEIGAQKSGSNSYVWDGNQSNGLPVKTGNYIFRVSAVDDKGQSIETNPLARAKVVGVSFEGQEAVFLIGDINRPDKVTMRNIVKIEDNSGVGGNQAGIQGVEQPQKNLNLISFQKGVGSSNADPNGLAPAAAGAYAQMQQQQQPSQTAQAPQAMQQQFTDNEKGFPNGLKETEEQIPIQMKGGEKL